METFLNEVFGAGKDRIRAFPGCQHMELLRQKNQPNVLFTLSFGTMKPRWRPIGSPEAYSKTLGQKRKCYLPKKRSVVGGSD